MKLSSRQVMEKNKEMFLVPMKVDGDDDDDVGDDDEDDDGGNKKAVEAAAKGFEIIEKEKSKTREERGEKRKLPWDNQDVENKRKQTEDDDVIKSMSLKLLTEKEKKVEQFMLNFLNTFQKKNGTELGFSADLSFQEKLAAAEKKMNEVSMILAHKYQPIIREIFSQHEQQKMDNQYGVIKANQENEKDLSKQYKDCYVNFVKNDDCVSFQTANKEMLKNISIKDYFTLVYWAMNTCKRQPGDNLLQLIVCGKSSCGKSAIFENPIQQISHNMTTDPGVGRFLTKSKSTLLLHDCDLQILVKGKDVDKLKSITRTEPISVKDHSTAHTVNAMHVMVTSNKHMFVHRFKKPKVEGFCSRTIYKSDIQSTKTIHEMDIEAVRNRYIECFVRDRPELPPGSLPTSGNFTRKDMIKGLFHLIIDILSSYEKSDFLSDYLYLYAIIGLCKNLHLMNQTEQCQLEQVIVKLFVCEYGLSQEQQMQCFNSFQRTQEMKSDLF